MLDRILIVTAVGSLALAAPAFTHAGNTTDAREQAWIGHASGGIDTRALDALARIRDTGRRLLALRTYLRAGDSLSSHWSWSQQRLSDYPMTPEGRAASADIDAVEAAFASANPGFTARANRKPRSLEVQICRWNDNQSVGAAAADLLAALEHQFPTGNSPSTAQLRLALTTWKPTVAPTLAAPGLSAHGEHLISRLSVTASWSQDSMPSQPISSGMKRDGPVDCMLRSWPRVSPSSVRWRHPTSPGTTPMSRQTAFIRSRM